MYDKELADSLYYLLFDNYEEIKNKHSSLIRSCDIYIQNTNSRLLQFNKDFNDFIVESELLNTDIIKCRRQLNKLALNRNQQETLSKTSKIQDDKNIKKKLSKSILRISTEITDLIKEINFTLNSLIKNVSNTVSNLHNEMETIIYVNQQAEFLFKKLEFQIKNYEELKNIFFVRLVDDNQKNKITIIVKKITDHNKLTQVLNRIEKFRERLIIIERISNNLKKTVSSFDRKSSYELLCKTRDNLHKIKIKKFIKEINELYQTYKKQKSNDFEEYNQYKNKLDFKSLNNKFYNQEIERVSKLYIQELPYQISEIYNDIEVLNVIDKKMVSKLESSIKAILLILNIPDNYIILKNIKYSVHDKKIYTHLFNVCIYSLLIGVELGYSESELIELGLCGLFHDIGYIEMKNRHKNLALDYYKDELGLNYNIHPTLGLKVLLKRMKIKEYFSKDMRNSIIQHHVYNDFTGYPKTAVQQAITNQYIPEYARIIRITDEYDLLTLKNQSHKEKAFLEMKKMTNNNKFDQDFLNIFLKEKIEFVCT